MGALRRSIAMRQGTTDSFGLLWRREVLTLTGNRKRVPIAMQQAPHLGVPKLVL